MNSKWFIASTIVISLLGGLIEHISATPKFIIVNMAPDGKIKIGEHYYGIDDTIRMKDCEVGKVYWNMDLEDQAFEIMCVMNCDTVKWSGVKEIGFCRNLSLLQSKQAEENSFASLAGLVGKGVIREPIVLWKGKSIPLKGIVVEEGCDYYCRPKNNYLKFSLTQHDGLLYLNADDFSAFDTKFTLEIIKTNNRTGEYQSVAFLDVEQIK